MRQTQNVLSCNERGARGRPTFFMLHNNCEMNTLKIKLKWLMVVKMPSYSTAYRTYRVHQHSKLDNYAQAHCRGGGWIQNSNSVLSLTSRAMCTTHMFRSRWTDCFAIHKSLSCDTIRCTERFRGSLVVFNVHCTGINSEYSYAVGRWWRCDSGNNSSTSSSSCCELSNDKNKLYSIFVRDGGAPSIARTAQRRNGRNVSI